MDKTENPTCARSTTGTSTADATMIRVRMEVGDNSVLDFSWLLDTRDPRTLEFAERLKTNILRTLIISGGGGSFPTNFNR